MATQEKNAAEILDTGGLELRIGSPMRPGCRSRLQHDRWNDHRDCGGRDNAVDLQQRRPFCVLPQCHLDAHPNGTQCGSAGVAPVCSAGMKLANPELVSHARWMR